MSNEELEKYKNRLYELESLSIIASGKKDYVALSGYMKEIMKINKKLKKAKKNAVKNENK